MARNFSDDQILLGDVVAARFDKDAVWTCCLSAKADVLSRWHHPLAKWNGSTARQFAMTVSGTDDKPRIDMDDGNIIASAFVTVADTWYLWVVTCDGAAGITFFLLGPDGTFHVNGDTGTGSDASGQTLPIVIGTQVDGSTTESWDGDIAEVAYFVGKEFDAQDCLSYLRNPAKVAGQYGTEFYLPILGVASPEPDLSGNGNNGTVTGTVRSDHPPIFPGIGFDDDLVATSVAAALLQAALSASATVAADLTTAIEMAASVSGTATVAAALTTAIEMAASVSGTATVAADLTIVARFQTSVSGTAAVAAALTTAIEMAASVSGTATVSADLTTAFEMAASVSGTATVAADLTTAIEMAASVSGTATVSADLTAGVTFEASVTGIATVAAALTTAIQMAASVTGTATVTAVLTTVTRFEAAVTGTATVAAVLTTSIKMAASFTGTGTVTAILTTSIEMAASVSGTATVAAILTTQINLVASVTGTAAVIASLTVPPQAFPTRGFMAQPFFN